MENSKVLQEDFEYILNGEVDFSKFENTTILITGATGLVGSLLVKTLLYANETRNYGIKVVALIRNKDKADKIFKEYKKENLSYLIANLGKNEIEYSGEIDYIIHTAAVTQSKVMIQKPVETIKTAINGTEELLNLAVNKYVSSMVYVSSMEVYGQPSVTDKVKENDLGYIDLTSVRAGYPESKRMCELLCTSYSSQYKLNVKSARLAQTFGAGILPTENRVFAQFARSAVNGEDIVLHTEGKSEGNYVYTADAVKALFFLLLNGESGQAYNVSNEDNHMTIKEMAEMVIANFAKNDQQKVVIDIPKENLGYAPDVKMWLSNKKLVNLGWKPQQDMIKSYQRMILWIKGEKSNERV